MRRIILYLTLSTVLFAAIIYGKSMQSFPNSLPVPGNYSVTKSKVSFLSKAPLEQIEATSEELKGMISQIENTFAFTIAYTSFMGFNSPLQREHFNENFMESDKYSNASYAGRIIDPVAWNDTGTSDVRVKGTLDIHGIQHERILPAKVTVKQDYILIYCQFPIKIADHNITIPRVLNQKIAEEVTVTVAARLTENIAR